MASYDPDLWPVLERATREDLQPLIEMIENNHWFGWRAQATWTLDQLRKAIHNLLTWEGGNSFVNVFRGGGPRWSETVRDAAAKLGVRYGRNDTVPRIEEQILVCLVERIVRQMTPEQRQQFERECRDAALRAGIPYCSGGFVAAIIAGELAGFLPYQLLLVLTNALAKTLLGQGLTLVGNQVLVRALSVVLGPVGWVASGAWLIVDLAGPARRLTIPGVVHVGVLRANQG